MRALAPFLLAGMALLPALGATQSFPSRPITIIVPYPPGGLIDLVARLVQQPLSAELGQTVLVENRSGVGGNLGAEQVARATPDGYTLLLGNPSLAISEHIYPKLNYRPLQDLAYVGQYGKVPNVLMVHPSFPAKSVPELIALLKANPGKYNYASNGFGTSPQLSSELFKAMTNTYIVHIPFRGSGPATASFIAGETQMMFDNIPPQVGNIKAGKARALAVTSLKRSHVFPDLPTLDEVGLKGYEVTAWFGLNAPAATSKEVVTKINEALNRATAKPELRDQLVQRGAEVIQGTPEQYLEYVRAESAKFGPVVKRAGIKAE